MVTVSFKGLTADLFSIAVRAIQLQVYTPAVAQLVIRSTQRQLSKAGDMIDVHYMYDSVIDRLAVVVMVEGQRVSLSLPYGLAVGYLTSMIVTFLVDGALTSSDYTRLTDYLDGLSQIDVEKLLKDFSAIAVQEKKGDAVLCLT
jgi:hypothetical protein